MPKRKQMTRGVEPELDRSNFQVSRETFADPKSKRKMPKPVVAIQIKQIASGKVILVKETNDATLGKMFSEAAENIEFLYHEGALFGGASRGRIYMLALATFLRDHGILDDLGGSRTGLMSGRGAQPKFEPHGTTDHRQSVPRDV